MANAKIPRVIDGVCVCTLCCEVKWLNEWDCTSLVWKTPTLLDNKLIAGPCPSNLDWEYTTGCFAQGTFYYPVADADFCKDCPDPPPTPPTNTLPMPSSCCSCFSWEFFADLDCNDGEYELNGFIGPTPVAAPCPVDTPWNQNGCCGQSRIMYTTGDAPEDEPDPGDPPPASTLTYILCCGGCCAETFEAVWDGLTWTVTSIGTSFTFDFSCDSDVEWTWISGCTYRKTLRYLTGGDCETCQPQSPPTPPFDGGTPPDDCLTLCNTCVAGTASVSELLTIPNPRTGGSCTNALPMDTSSQGYNTESGCQWVYFQSDGTPTTCIQTAIIVSNAVTNVVTEITYLFYSQFTFSDSGCQVLYQLTAPGGIAGITCVGGALTGTVTLPLISATETGSPALCVTQPATLDITFA